MFLAYSVPLSTVSETRRKTVLERFETWVVGGRSLEGTGGPPVRNERSHRNGQSHSKKWEDKTETYLFLFIKLNRETGILSKTVTGLFVLKGQIFRVTYTQLVC